MYTKFKHIFQSKTETCGAADDSSSEEDEVFMLLSSTKPIFNQQLARKFKKKKICTYLGSRKR